MEGLATYMSPVNRLASYLIVFLVIAALPYSSRADDFSEVGSPTVPLPVLKCLVCRAIVDEVEAKIDKVDPKKKLDVGGFRLDGDGNMKQNTVPYARSETFISEVVDEVCSGEMKNYVVAHYKDTLRPTLFRMVLPNGNMNPEMTDVELVKSPTVNDKLSYYCNSIVEDHEEDIVSSFTKGDKDPHASVCVNKTGICPKGAADNVSNSHKDSDDSYNFEHEDL